MKFIQLLRRIIGVREIEMQMNALLRKNMELEEEILSAMKFNSTIIGSSWFVHQSISPGGSAVDYAFFYTLYRVLTSIKPKNILEFGLGQSSKMIHQYANYYKVNAVTVEHDPSWISFFDSDRDGHYTVNTKVLDLEKTKYNGVEVLTYKDCLQTFCKEKFDLIIVDGPFGFSKETVYSRPQIIDLCKSCLNDNFVIILDDYDREGEKNTAKELFKIFEARGVKYETRIYGSIKQHLLITVPEYKFLTSL